MITEHALVAQDPARVVIPPQTREQIREQVRQSIEQARVDAARAQADARAAAEDVRAALAQEGFAQGGARVGQPPVPPVPPSPPNPDGEAVIVTGDGRTIRVDAEGNVVVDGELMTTAEEPPPFPFGPDGPHIPSELVVILVAFFVMIAIVAVGTPIARAFARRMDRRAAAAPELASVGERLDRIEQAIETVAVEVERISEGQRYTARLMSEMQPRQPERIPAGDASRGR